MTKNEQTEQAPRVVVRRRKKRPPLAWCYECDDQQTHARCIQCGYPVCDGCAQQARNRICTRLECQDEARGFRKVEG